MVIVIIVSVIAVVFLSASLSLLIVEKSMVEKSKGLTMDELFEKNALLEKIGIKDKKNPGDYGLQYENTTFYSLDKTKLNGWYIPSENRSSKKVLILLHGRSHNKGFLLPYMELYKKMGLFKEFSVFMMDFRNAGESQRRHTKMGFKYSEDIYSLLEFLKEDYNRSEVILHAFSQGTMGMLLCQKRFEKNLKKKGIEIKKMILDSPLANVSRTLKYHFYKRAGGGYLNNILRFFLELIFNLRIGCMLDDMKISSLLTPDIEYIVFQAESDVTTPKEILEYELERSTGKIEYVKFDRGHHAFIYQSNQQSYMEILEKFISKGEQWKKDYQ